MPGYPHIFRLLPFVPAILLSCCAFAGPVGAKNGHVDSRWRRQPLQVGSSAATQTQATDANTVTPPSSPTPASASHTVKKGETLWRISRRYGVTVAAISTINNLKDPTSIAPGLQLKLPTAGSTAPAPKSKLSSDAHPPAKTEVAVRPGTARPRAAAVATKPYSKTRAKQQPGSRAKKSSGNYPLNWPVEGTITSRFGKRRGRAHDGIDISAPTGSSVRAAAAGEVLFAATHGSYGNLVVLKHADGLVTVYAHNERNLVRKGQTVRKGQLLGKVGQTGRASGPHLHFEVRKGTTPKNPLRFLPP